VVDLGRTTIICSAEILAAIRDAPIAHHGKDRPAKK
jgi:hypothetical protein